MEDEIDLKDYLKILLKRWKLIVFLGIVASLMALVFGLSQAKMYRSTTTLMLTDSGTGGLVAQLSLFSGGGGASGGGDKLIPILKSKVLATQVANNVDANWFSPLFEKKSNLSNGEKIKLMAEKLNGAIDGKMGGSLFEVSAVWEDPKIAAAIANKYVEYLGKFLNERALSINFQLIDLAVPSENPFNRQVRPLAIVGLIMGAFFGALMAFFFEYWETSTKNKKQV